MEMDMEKLYKDLLPGQKKNFLDGIINGLNKLERDYGVNKEFIDLLRQKYPTVMADVDKQREKM